MANPVVQQINDELEILQKELGQFKATVEYLNGAKTHVKDAVQSVAQAESMLLLKVEELKSTHTAFNKLSDSITSLLTKIDGVNFPERLDTIEKTVKETVKELESSKKATLGELQKASEIITKADFDGRFKNLQASIDNSINSNIRLANTTEKLKLPEKIEGFERNITKQLEISVSDFKKTTKQIATDTANSIHILNLPIRFDKLDANVAGIQAAIQNVQARVESVERNIVEKLKDDSDKQRDLFINLQEKINQSIKGVEEEVKLASRKQRTSSYIALVVVILVTFLIIYFCKRG